MYFRMILAIIAAKIAMYLSRLTGRGRGSSLPGMLALRIYPGLLKHYQGQARKGVIMVTGTNGKTTTSNMLVGILDNVGHKIVANQEGANLITGVATAFIKSSTLTGRVQCDYAVLEVDEAAFPQVSGCINPNMVVVTNFFRDQLDRYGELDTTISKVLAAIKRLPGETVLILNADDPLVSRFKRDTHYRCVFYGVFPAPELSSEASYSREAKFCPFCGNALTYSIYLYSQLGNYKCFGCGFLRPQPDIEATDLQNNDNTITANILIDNAEYKIKLPVRGVYNLYNALASFSAALSLGVAPSSALVNLQKYKPATGRMESFLYGNKQVTLTLVKNPTGFNQALASLTSGEINQDVMIAINDNDADGRDISWLWDVDFEVLAQHLDKYNQFVCTGQRGEEIALRLKYAGIPVGMLKIEKNYEKAIEMSLKGNGNAAGILATYTALWPVEKILCHQAERVNQFELDSVSPVS